MFRLNGFMIPSAGHSEELHEQFLACGCVTMFCIDYKFCIEPSTADNFCH